MKKRKLIWEIISLLVTIIIIITIVFVLNITVFTISWVNQVSMKNTLIEGDIVYYNRLANKPDHYNREDIVLFLEGGRERHGVLDSLGIKITDLKDLLSSKGKFSNVRYVKRIIGIPGDIIDIDNDGNVYVNGEKENKPYVLGQTFKGDIKYPIKVPEDNFFVMGDNREMSKDSRQFGCVSINSFEGKATFILWPFSRVKRIK